HRDERLGCGRADRGEDASGRALAEVEHPAEPLDAVGEGLRAGEDERERRDDGDDMERAHESAVGGGWTGAPVIRARSRRTSGRSSRIADAIMRRVASGLEKKIPKSPWPAMRLLRSSRSVESPSTSATTSGARGYFIFRSQYPTSPKMIVKATSSIELFREYEPMIEIVTMKGVMIA